MDIFELFCLNKDKFLSCWFCFLGEKDWLNDAIFGLMERKGERCLGSQSSF